MKDYLGKESLKFNSVWRSLNLIFSEYSSMPKASFAVEINNWSNENTVRFDIFLKVSIVTLDSSTKLVLATVQMTPAQ